MSTYLRLHLGRKSQIYNLQSQLIYMQDAIDFCIAGVVPEPLLLLRQENCQFQETLVLRHIIFNIINSGFMVGSVGILAPLSLG